MTKSLRAKHLTQAADELRAVKAALEWHAARKLVALADSDFHVHHQRVLAFHDAELELARACELMERRT